MTSRPLDRLPTRLARHVAARDQPGSDEYLLRVGRRAKVASWFWSTDRFREWRFGT